MSREILSSRAFENWYFEYCEAERELQDAQRSFEVKKRDACLFLFSAYSKWCTGRFGEILRPEQTAVQCEVEDPGVLFFDEYKIGSSLRSVLSQMLNQVYDERFGGVSKNE